MQRGGKAERDHTRADNAHGKLTDEHTHNDIADSGEREADKHTHHRLKDHRHAFQAGFRDHGTTVAQLEQCGDSDEKAAYDETDKFYPCGLDSHVLSQPFAAPNRPDVGSESGVVKQSIGNEKRGKADDKIEGGIPKHRQWLRDGIARTAFVERANRFINKRHRDGYDDRRDPEQRVDRTRNYVQRHPEENRGDQHGNQPVGQPHVRRYDPDKDGNGSEAEVPEA